MSARAARMSATRSLSIVICIVFAPPFLWPSTLTRQRLVHNISLHCDNVFNRVYRDNLSVIKDFIPQPARGFRLNYQAMY